MRTTAKQSPRRDPSSKCSERWPAPQNPRPSHTQRHCLTLQRSRTISANDTESAFKPDSLSSGPSVEQDTGSIGQSHCASICQSYIYKMLEFPLPEWRTNETHLTLCTMIDSIDAEVTATAAEASEQG